jgi:hypothetical protein
MKHNLCPLNVYVSNAVLEIAEQDVGLRNVSEL